MGLDPNPRRENPKGWQGFGKSNAEAEGWMAKSNAKSKGEDAKQEWNPKKRNSWGKPTDAARFNGAEGTTM